jgi:hypothetical protein
MKERDLEHEKLSEERDGRDVSKEIALHMLFNFLISLCFGRNQNLFLESQLDCLKTPNERLPLKEKYSDIKTDGLSPKNVYSLH